MNKIQQIARRPDVKAVLAGFEQKLPELTDLALQVQQIPSPTFREQRRADFVQSQFARFGLQDVEQDDLHNVFGRFRGRGDGAPLVVSAHLDTVFAADTDLSELDD